MATARVPQYRQEYQQRYYRDEDPQYFRRQDRRQDRWSVRCFLCNEGHFAYRCPARALLQRFLRQHAQEQVRRPLPSGQVLELPRADGHSQAPPPPPDAFKLTEGSPKAKVVPVGVRSCAAHFRPIVYRGHPSRGTGGHRGVHNLPWLRHLVVLPRPMGSTKAIHQCSPWCSWQTATDSW